MKISIVAVGKIKENYLREAISEYEKRLSKFCDLNIIEIEEKNAKDEEKSAILKSMQDEAALIIKKIKDISTDKKYLIALDIDGKELDTLKLHSKLRDEMVKGSSHIVFIIGGSYGLDKSVKDIVDYRLSFSKLTFPHQLFRVILLEQIYRIFKIDRNEPYHK